jgi:hypothetical protein
MIYRTLLGIVVTFAVLGALFHAAEAAPRSVCRPGQFEKICQVDQARLFSSDSCPARPNARVNSPCTCVFNGSVVRGRVMLGDEICCINGQFC